MKNLKLIACLFLLLPSMQIFVKGQTSQPADIITQKIDDLFGNWPEVYFSFQLANTADLHYLTKIISIDNVKDGTVTAYANKKRFSAFLKTGLTYKILQHPSTIFKDECVDNLNIKQPMAWDVYPTYQAYETMMYQFETNYPELCRISNIGTLASGRKLLVAKISSNVDSAMNKPQFFYGSSIHGDEVTCYVNMLRYIDYLLSNYNVDPYITGLLNSIEIYINPLSNPDGTYHGGNNSVSQATRYNANGIDLNRNFPDPAGGLHPDGEVWQPETQAFMDFANQHHFVMGCNFHGGAEVVNYPWDTWSVLAADDNWWQYVSRQFADTIHVYNSTGYFTDLNNGITNGWAWYEIEGGRQDYMNYWHHCREVTIEVSANKKPAASTLPTYWNSLHRSILTYMEQSRYGIRGIVTDSITGEPLHAKVYITGHDIDSSEVYSYLPVGNYHRLLYPGTYNLTFSCPGYITKTIHNLVVTNYQATINNVQLAQLGIGISQPATGELSIYPNPVTSQFTLLFAGSTGFYTLELFNTLGQKCFSETLPLTDGVHVPINIEKLPAGIYTLQLRDSLNTLKTAKVVKR